MELVRTVMLNVIVLVFFATVLDLLLPDGRFRSYIKMAMGFFTVLVLVQPAVNLLQHDYTAYFEEIPPIEQAALAESADAVNHISVYDSTMPAYTAQAEAQYAAQTARQIEALLLLGDYDVHDVQCCFTEADDTTNQRKLMIQIQIQMCEAYQEKQEQIRTAISGYFDLDIAQVQIEWMEAYCEDGIKSESTD